MVRRREIKEADGGCSKICPLRAHIQRGSATCSIDAPFLIHRGGASCLLYPQPHIRKPKTR